MDLWDPINFNTDDKWLFYYQLVINVSFFLIINTIALNVIFGIIIDTFGELREITNKEGFNVENNFQKKMKRIFAIFAVQIGFNLKNLAFHSTNINKKTIIFGNM